MSTRILNRKIPSHRRSVDPANPLYGYDYRPDWPSILSVAHDEADGGKLFVITDRPCILVSADLPLDISGLFVVGAAAVLPVKFQIGLSDAVPRGSAWRWGGGNGSLYDPVSGHGLNAAAGYCADIPGPYTPPPPASVISSGASGMSCTLQFDRPVIYTGAAPDDAITFDGVAPLGVFVLGADTLGFTLGNFVSSGSTWNISRQPTWIASGLVVPENGVFP